MYVSKRQVTMQSGIATLTAIALVLWALGAHMFTTAEAANLTYVKDTLSDSNPSTVSNHTIQFLSPTGVGTGQNMTVTFPAGFNLTAVDFSDMDLSVGGSNQTLAAASAPGVWGVNVAGQIITISSNDTTVGSNATVTLMIGTNATGGVANAQITNPSATTSHEITITAGSADSGQTRVAIIDHVSVTANVDTTLTFTVSGTSTAKTISGVPTTTSATSTSTTLPFGTLAANVPKILAQDLTVATNARNGYVVTVDQKQNLLSSTGADIDGFVDGLYTNTPQAWVAPSNNINDENTWGHWGLTTTDTTLFGAGPAFAANQWIAASTTPRAIMAHTGPADGTTELIGRATIGYQAQITALQEAGDDYSTTLTYIATPTF
jgi:hypothetical protein